MAKQERFLCLKMMGKICGIDFSELLPTPEEEELKKKYSKWWVDLWMADWESLLPPPFDFIVDLPVVDSRPFVLDSDILLAGGFVSPLSEFVHSFDIYKFDIIGDEKEPRLNVCKSIPAAPVPVLFYASLLAKISGDCYFLVFHRKVTPGGNVFWVLRRGHREWEPLPRPPPLEKHDFFRDTQWFVLHHKLFLRTRVDDDGIYEGEEEPMLFLLYSFDPQTRTWTQHADDDSFMNSFRLRVHGYDLFCFPSITVSSVPGLSDSNCSLTLSCSYLQEFVNKFNGRHLLEPLMVHALLVNQNGVRLFQHIDDCFYRMQPTFFTMNAFLVDLGDGKVCALLYGRAREHDSGETPVLCISVFSLTMEDGLKIDAEASPQEESFLSVHVISKRVYTMKGCLDGTMEDYKDELQEVFMGPPTTKDKEMSRKRKELLH